MSTENITQVRRCLNCNKPFTSKVSVAKFCSDACRKKYNRTYTAKESVPVTDIKKDTAKFNKLRDEMDREVIDALRPDTLSNQMNNLVASIAEDPYKQINIMCDKYGVIPNDIAAFYDRYQDLVTDKKNLSKEYGGQQMDYLKQRRNQKNGIRPSVTETDKVK